MHLHLYTINSGIIILVNKQYDILHSKIEMPGCMINLKLAYNATKHEYNLTVYYAPQVKAINKTQMVNIIKTFSQVHDVSQNNILIGDFNFADKDEDKGKGMSDRDKMMNSSWEEFKSETSASVVASLDASVRKFGKALEESPVKLSRKRKREAVLHNNSDVTPADGYKIINASILPSILNCISKCYNCGTENKLLLQQNNKKRNGLCEMLILHCTSCNTDIKSFKTSQQTVNNKMADINLRSVLATTAVGDGLSTLRKLCTNFNLSQPVNEHPYNNYIKFIEGNSIKNCE